jgi:hypothetical protein
MSIRNSQQVSLQHTQVVLFSPPAQEQFTFNCTDIPLLFHIAPTTVQIFIKLCNWLFCSLLTSVCVFRLSNIMSRLFPPCHHLKICGCQDFATALKTDYNYSVINSPNTFRISVALIRAWGSITVKDLGSDIHGMLEATCNYLFTNHPVISMYIVYSC